METFLSLSGSYADMIEIHFILSNYMISLRFVTLEDLGLTPELKSSLAFLVDILCLLFSSILEIFYRLEPESYRLKLDEVCIDSL